MLPSVDFSSAPPLGAAHLLPHMQLCSLSIVHLHVFLSLWLLRHRVTGDTAGQQRPPSPDTEGGPTCKPQEGLALSPPYQRPYYVPGGLPLCQQYGCSCCNRTHALLLFRSLRGTFDDATFSKSCSAMLTQFACRVCDPEVGVGIKPLVCSHTCQKWYDACKDEFFGFDHRSDALAPCPEGANEGAAGGGSDGGMLLCSKLHRMVQDGNELCKLAGLQASPVKPCFDGTPPNRPDLCTAAPPPSSTSSSSSTSSKSKARRSTDGNAKGDGSLGFWPTVIITLAVAVFLRPEWFRAALLHVSRAVERVAGQIVPPAAGPPVPQGALGGQQPGRQGTPLQQQQPQQRFSDGAFKGKGRYAR